MKNTYFVCLMFLFSGIAHLSYAQEVQFSAELPEVREEFVGATEDKMIYSKPNVNGITGKVSVEYIAVNTKNPEEKKKTTKPKVEFSEAGGSIERLLVQGNFIYEFYETTGSIAVVKRSLETLEQSGSVLELKDYTFKYAKCDEGGMYLFSKTKLYRIDLDLNLVWKRDYEMFSDVNVRLTSIEIDDNLNVLMTVAVDEQVKTKFFGSTPPAKSSLLFIITNPDGEEPKVISPEIPESLTVQAARFNYNAKSSQLSGLFITAKEVGVNPGFAKGFAYTFLKWDDEGSIVNHEKHDFVFNDFMDEDMKKNIPVMGVKPEKCDFDKWMRYPVFSNIRFLENGNALFVATSLGKYVGEMENSKVMFLLSPDGKLIWQKMLPYSSNALYLNADFFVSDNQLHFLIQDFVKSFESGSYKYAIINSPASGKTVCLSERVFDLENGNELSNRFIANPSEKFMPTKVIYNKDGKAIVRYSFTTKNLERFLTINF
jgi:outer membrane protein assembly factor BamB